MRPYEFRDSSGGYRITEPIPIYTTLEENLEGINNKVARQERGDHSPLSLNSSSEEAFIKSIRSLLQKGKQVCLQTRHELEKAAFDKRHLVRAAAIDALGMMEEQTPISILLEAFSDPHWDVRAAAAQALGRAGNRVQINTLIDILLHEKNENVQEALISTLGLQEERTPIDILTYYLRDGENWLTRVAAAWALGKQGERAPTSKLVHALSDSDEMVREAVARVLGTLKKWDKEIEGALLYSCYDSDEIVQEAASWALAQIATSSPYALQPPRRLPTSFDGMHDWMGQSLPDTSFQNSDHQSEQVQRNKALTALTDFVRNRKGDLQHSAIFPSPAGQTLLIMCDYQNAETNILQILQDLQVIKKSKSLSTELDDMIRFAFMQAVENGVRRPWDELLIVSLTISSINNEPGQDFPLRVVISGMGYPDIRNKEPILDQIVTTWEESTSEPLICKRPDDLIDLKIWYQPPENDFVLQLTGTSSNL